MAGAETWIQLGSVRWCRLSTRFVFFLCFLAVLGLGLSGGQGATTTGFMSLQAISGGGSFSCCNSGASSHRSSPVREDPICCSKCTIHASLRTNIVIVTLCYLQKDQHCCFAVENCLQVMAEVELVR
ncbi:hypothetical protein SETIT_5G369500v2 [Setaria italica]|uniref:Uncharacterized protein n=1 Tax=Setaria italica TaxID=4555 RepID=A0A368RCP1_SETIT|nr:hypothetical protein SETIT_5G369500v2 [Setaria italica]